MQGLLTQNEPSKARLPKPDATGLIMQILHLEDRGDDALLVRDLLHREFAGCQLTRVETRREFVRSLDGGDWDVILADYSLPSFDGISAMKLAVARCPGVPFIFVTGALGEELAVETLKSGATDYVMKPRLDRLPEAIRRARRENETAKAQKEAEHKLKASLIDKDRLLREKDVLLQEVHHRVNNNLQIVCSLLSMQSDSANDAPLASALRESQRRVHSMAMIHEMLYASSNLSDIDFAEYIRALAAEVFSSYGLDPARVQLAFELQPLLFEIGRAIPCGLILNELLSNALKYAFPDGRTGQIRVSLQQHEFHIELIVEDNGAGLPETYSPNEAKSLGLRIVNTLTRQLGASIEITSNRGAHFVLRLPRDVVKAAICA